MKKLFDVIRVANEGRFLFYNSVPRRGVRYQENLKWVKPEKKPLQHPSRTGDLIEFPKLNYDSIFLPFKDCKELQNADEKVKKVFSLGYQWPSFYRQSYEHELVEKVKCHANDRNSLEVQIAKLTAKIRYFQKVISIQPKKIGKRTKMFKEAVDARRKKLRILRSRDYKKFEWLLEKLDLEYRPPPTGENNRVTRKKCLTLLAKLKVEQAKEKKLAAYKKALDEQKVPFLEKKIMKLKEIKAEEEKYNLPATVTEKDIQECIEKLEKVKVEVAEKAKKGYIRKIHPYFLEPYEEDLLREKEKASQLIREKLSGESQKEKEGAVS